MKMNDYKNPEGYADPTAYNAIRKIQGEDMERGTVIKYTNSRDIEDFMVVLGFDGEIVTGITLYPSQRNESVQVFGMFAMPSRIRFMYLNSIPDYQVAGYASDNDLADLLCAVGVYFGIGTHEARIYAPDAEKPGKTNPVRSEDVSRIVELETEARIYKGLYENLLARLTA